MALPIVDIKLKKPDKTYFTGSTVSGVIVVDSPKEPIQHQGVQLVFEGTVILTHGLDNSAFSSQEKKQLVRLPLDISPAGKFPKGITELPFEFKLELSEGSKLFETYHGILVNVRYSLTCDIPRGMFSKPLKKSIEVIVVVESKEKLNDKPLEFEMTSAKMKNKDSSKDLPTFQFKGKINSRFCNIVTPFTGELRIVSCSIPIRSVELQLVRVETICGVKQLEAVTEIQNIQIADGDILPGTTIPIHMVLPRLFTCSTQKSSVCNLEFEVNVVVLFQDQSLVSENVPVVFYRTKSARDKIWTDV